MNSRTFYTFLFLISLCYDLYPQSPTIFFPNDHVQKTAVIPAYDDTPATQKAPATIVDIDFNNVVAPVSKYIYGANANIYMTQVVDQPELIKGLKQLSPNIIRFPGGTIGGTYFFNKVKGQLPPDAPAKILDGDGKEVTPNYWFGMNTESWTMSIDNYYSMLETIGSTGIITVNYDYARYSTATDPVGSAAHLAADWVRYDNGRTRFWEIGNESYGTWQYGFRINTSANKDGQPAIITGDLYGKHFKVFADSMRKAAMEKGATIYIGAMLKEEAPAVWWNDTDRNWNAGIFQQAGSSPDYYIVHSYYTPYAANSNATDILNSAATVTKNNHDYVQQSMTAAGFGSKPIALTEWNIFAEGSKQQVSFINGMHAAMLLGEGIKNKYAMAMRWDLANGWNNGNDHGMFNTGDEPGGMPKWNPRPSFYYMYYFQKYFGDTMVQSTVTSNSNIAAYASLFASGQAGIVLVNKVTAEQTVALNMNNFGFGTRYYYYTLTGGTDNGEFSLKVSVNGIPPSYASGGPSNFETIKARSTPIGTGVTLTLPGRSVIYILVENGTNVITGTTDHEETGVRVFPNPARTAFSVILPEGFSEISIVDTSGRTVATSQLGSAQTHVNFNIPLPRGLYIIKLVGAGKTVSTKISID
ncbi:MAG TPA: T9SS type A sorting domain-containing protein [Cyclobacteriaceae bacterium]|nr:T9SS type A sorting domain-containing protein [Cyclobacteriaceae bacterium]